MDEQIISVGNSNVSIVGQTINPYLLFLYHFTCVCTGGLLYVINRWINFYPFYQKSQFKNATHVLVKTDGESSYLKLGNTSDSTVGSKGMIPIDDIDVTFFSYRCFRFVFSPTLNAFVTAGQINVFEKESLQSASNGLFSGTVDQRLRVFGENNLLIPEKSTLVILVEEIIHPFMVFQILSICLWFSDEYYYYASCILFITIISVVDTLIETKKNYAHLRELCKMECMVRAIRNEESCFLNSQSIVPGDVIEIGESGISIIPCDLLLVSGDCLVNESMLTGESTLVPKVPLAKNLSVANVFSEKKNWEKNILFHGTRLEKSKPGTKGIVINTGFNTSKGTMIRSILFPKATKFKFYSESMKFIGILFIIALFGFSLAIYNFLRIGTSLFRIIKRSFDVFTIVVPPALPATLSVGMTFALKRLRNIGITCISPTKINVGGRINCVCFDKTGTLTEEGLDLVAVIPVSDENFFCPNISEIDSIEGNEDGNRQSQFIKGVCLCNSLREHEGRYVGDPIDMKLFEFTKAHLNEVWHQELAVHLIHVNCPLFDGNAIILECHDFVPRLRRMSSVVQFSDGSIVAYVKGAPEVILELSEKGTVPINVKQQLKTLTEKGYRVIAMGHKTLPAGIEYKRDMVESNLTFSGLIVLENRIKTQTPNVLKTLNKSGFFSVMSTGDNILTSLSVSRECQIFDSGNVYVAELESNVLVWKSSYDDDQFTTSELFVEMIKSSMQINTSPSLAMTGDVFEFLLAKKPDEFEKILRSTKVYARMSPEQKAMLVEQLQEIGYCVAMVGDGNNDVAALAASDVGISLSDEDASVAASFTANKSVDIESILHVIREGRTALVTSYSCFKYMAIYSLTQFTTISLLYFFGSSLADLQFLFVDLIIVLPLALTMGRSKPLSQIVKDRPTSSLISYKLMISLIGHLLFQILMQICIYFVVRIIPTYKPMIPARDEKNTPSFENTALFMFSIYLYMTYACIFSIGAPYRESAWKNRIFVIVCVMLLILNTIIVFADPSVVSELKLVVLPLGFKFVILGSAILAAVLSWVLESLLFPFLVRFASRRKKRTPSLLPVA